MQGSGTYVNSSGSKYEGQFEMSMREGYGTENFGNRLGIPYVCPLGRRHCGSGYCVYEGEWLRGYFHGRGEFVCEDGRKYQGTFDTGKRHGKGTQSYLKEGELGDSERMFIGGVDSLYRIAQYTGVWDKDSRTGVGEVVYTNGDKIRGPFLNGQPHGEVNTIFEPYILIFHGDLGLSFDGIIICIRKYVCKCVYKYMHMIICSFIAVRIHDANRPYSSAE